MPLTPEQIEDRLKVLEEQNRVLRAEVKTRPNPFENLVFQLALENGSTVSARTRRMSMTATQFSQAHFTRYADGAIQSNGWGCRVPSDWVSGTDITVNVFLVAAATGTAVFRSRLGINKEGDTHSNSNIENFAVTDIAMTANITYLYSRTIPNASIEAGDASNWLLQRRGSDAADTVNNSVNLNSSAWIEYTAFF